ncbi:unnamed protein product [Allacma fusca]|uniref:Uncharacterized protein n=1 Tax=Allacma fusca TaxID=39272 RepID=A0A8J2LLA1_9HEXA|nr:unnamed protein product [Allacma fusca]
MGIPKFYRWISERYPCLSEKIREYQIPDFDNLYLDMNGIIHTCSHPNDDDVHLRIPEEAVFKEIFRYIDFLFKMIKPRKVFFMAIDGVAPRAKMNQQRGRRFRSAKLALDQEAEAIKKGEKLPSEERFDSNCITPGTEFMARLHEHLQYFVKVKVSTDPLWQREGLVVILSGHDVPGEGEHKIMDYIRHIRSQTDYDAETRHCLYGLDADLIMLGLSTHELHFSLLREEVKFGPIRKRRRPQPPPQTADKKPLDLNSVSVFNHPEQKVENGGTPDEKSENLADVSQNDIVTQTYAAAAKIEPVVGETTPVPSSELSNVEKQIIPPSNDVQRKKKDTYHPPLPEKTTFLLLHLSLMRDYLDEEFSDLKEKLKDNPQIEYNLENIIDDWILMCILVGNDFVPNLPHLHITTNALPMVYARYMNVLPKLGGYINENGLLNLQRFEAFLREISVFDVENFRSTYDDMKYMASKTGKNIVLGDAMMEAFEFDDKDGFKEEAIEGEEPAPSGMMSELQALINRTEETVFGSLPDDETNGESKKGETSLEAFPANDDIFEEDDSPELRLEFAQSKRNYYMTKMDFKEVQKQVQQLAIEYIRAVQWVLLYYYKGVSSWCWYYPAHYAPFASDLINFKDAKLTFDKGQPFRPFEQLLGVLPSQSKKLLPKCYQSLMTNADSPIINFYPEKFEQDLNGKKQDWEAVILIPFIDEIQLLNAMETEYSKLSDNEKFRNSRGKMLVYSYKSHDTGIIEAPGEKFPSLPVSNFNLLGLDDVLYDPETLPKGIHPKAKQDTIYQGFPTIKSISHKSYLMDAQVKVFDMQARDVSMVLDLADENSQSKKLQVEEVAKNLLGKTVWVNWPHLTPALVTGVSDENVKYVEFSNDDLVIDAKYTAAVHKKTVEGLEKRHMTSKAIKLGDVDIVLWAKLMDGRKVRCDKHGRVIVDNLWQKLEQPFAYQTTITNDASIAVFSITGGEVNSFKDLFHVGDTVFLLDRELLGAKAVIQGHDLKRSRVKVDYSVPVYKNVNYEAHKDMYHALKKWNNNNYFSTHEASRMCNLDAYTFSKISGSIFVTVEKGQSPKKKSKGFSKRNQRGRGGKNDDEKSSSEDDIHLAQETKKVNVGLDLKFNKRNQKARGYTTKDVGDRGGKWAYSSKTVKLVRDYVEQFPDFVKYLSSMSSNVRNVDTYLAADIFPDDPIGKIKKMQEWVDGLGLRYSVQRIDLSSDILDDDEIQIIWNHILRCKVTALPDELKSKSIPPNMIYKPGLNRGSVQPVQGQTFQILDRIVCVDPSASMPLGQRGTVVGIQEPQVREQNDAIEESFKATNATMLLTLIILTDPQLDIFDKASEEATIPSTNAVGDSPNGIVKKDMTLALNQFLGLSFNKDDVPQVQCEPKENSTEEDYKPLPRLVKLFPYQVLNITDGEVESYVNVTSDKVCADEAISLDSPPRKVNSQFSTLYNKNNAFVNANNKRIPPLLSVQNPSPFPSKSNKSVVVPAGKYTNFVKATADSQTNNSRTSEFSESNRANNRNSKDKPKNSRRQDAGATEGGAALEQMFSAASKKQTNVTNTKQKKQSTALETVVGARAAASGCNNNKNMETNPSHPIVILKRPQQQAEQHNPSKPFQPDQGNPIFSLLESSLVQQRTCQNTSGTDGGETQSKSDDQQSQKPKGDRRGQQQRNLRNQAPQDVTVQSIQSLQQQNLLQLFQHQAPVNNPSPVVQRPSVHPFPPAPAVRIQPLLPQQQPQLYQGQTFSPHQQHYVRQQYLQHQRDINNIIRQQHMTAQQRQVVLPVQPLIHPSGVHSMPCPPVAMSTNQHKGNNASKTTTSFVPTQVLSGGRGTSSSFSGRSKKVYSTQTTSSNSNANVQVVKRESKDEFTSGKEIPIEELLQEASKKLSMPVNNSKKSDGKFENIKSADSESKSNSGADLLSQLANNLQNFGISNSGKRNDDNPDDANQPRKSRIAANFNFGP